MKTLVLFAAIALPFCSLTTAQTATPAPAEQQANDTLALAKAYKDSVRNAKMEKLTARLQYPYLKGGKWSGVIPVENPTEVPDPTREYKLLFEVIKKNPDSSSSEINYSLDEVARILNLHVASGIPGNRITPVVVIHGPGLEAVWNNTAYQRKHSMDNPNLKLVQDLKDVGTRFIVCGQAMAFFGTEKEDLLPGINITLTAQTVLSNYQIQGYVVYKIDPDN